MSWLVRSRTVGCVDSVRYALRSAPHLEEMIVIGNNGEGSKYVSISSAEEEQKPEGEGKRVRIY